MKERPIRLYQREVRAILDGSKTQMRRVVKAMPPMPEADCHPNHAARHPAPYFDAYCGQQKTPKNPRGMGTNWNWWQIDDRCCLPQIKCPYGQPGDQLWVRESFRFLDSFNKDSPATVGMRCLAAGYPKPWAPIQYEADGWQDNWMNVGTMPGPVTAGKLRQAIHMPRWASRIQLEITGIRVERLQDISEADALAEGVESYHTEFEMIYWVDGVKGYQLSENYAASAKEAYQRLWESINGPGSWEANPWVWVVEFRKANNGIKS